MDCPRGRATAPVLASFPERPVPETPFAAPAPLASSPFSLLLTSLGPGFMSIDVAFQENFSLRVFARSVWIGLTPSLAPEARGCFVYDLADSHSCHGTAVLPKAAP